MMWHPNKAAFRAGQVTNPLWDDVNIGSHSTAFGFNSAATGPYSFAAGVDAAAVGISGVAMGNNAQANGNYSTAFGTSTNASGAYAFVSGRNNSAVGAYSAAFGQLSSATGNHSVVFGSSSTAAGAASVAAEPRRSPTAAESVAMGLRVSAGGNGSVVLGSDAVAQAAASGTFIFADRSTTNDIVGVRPERVHRPRGRWGGLLHQRGHDHRRRDGGQGSSWAALSDVNVKENFRDVSGEEVLAKIARMSIQRVELQGAGRIAPPPGADRPGLPGSVRAGRLPPAHQHHRRRRRGPRGGQGARGAHARAERDADPRERRRCARGCRDSSMLLDEGR